MLSGAFKAELIEIQGPWRDLAPVERAVAQWVGRYNDECLHSALDYVPPVEYEQNYWPAQAQARALRPPEQPQNDYAKLRVTAVRAVLEEVARTAGHLLVGVVAEDWGRHCGRPPGPQAATLRQTVVQKYYRTAAGHLYWHTADDGGLPASSSAIVSPTTSRRALSDMNTSSAGKGSPPISPRCAHPTAST